MQTMQYNIAWSMGKARRNSLTDKHASQMPGPGIYKQINQENVKKANPKWSIKGKYPTGLKSLDGPGPGQYSDDFKKHNSPNYTFGGKRAQTKRSNGYDGPGPGTYQSPSTFGKKGGYVGVKAKAEKKFQGPGPGSYAMGTTFTKGFGMSFGGGKRSTANLNHSLHMPGPGAYDPLSDFGRKIHGAGFGSGKRGNLEGKHDHPGPGSYKVNESIYRDPKAASMKGRPQITKVDHRPGPGHYVSKSLHQSPAYSMGVKGKARKLGTEENPPPGSYNPEYTKIKHSVPGVNFGSPSKEVKGDNSMPGPGQYSLRTTVGSEGPAYGIRGRYKDPAGDIKPGPGNYNPKDDCIRHGNPGTVMGSGQRQPLMNGDRAPGPGMYDQETREKGKHFSFGSGLRDDGTNRQNKDNPGPGTYPVNGMVGKEGKGVIIAGKHKDRAPDTIPGPGTYDSKNNRNAPSFSISGHRTEDPVARNQASMPGPNIYNPDDSCVKQRQPTVSFGNKPKVSDLKDDGQPGPGQYQLKTTLEGKGVHIASKIPEKHIEKSPGPAAYSPSADAKYQNGPAFSISGVKGDMSLPNKDMPGPGTYNSQERPQSSGYSFSKDRRKDLANAKEEPGPGQYAVQSKIGSEGKNIIIAGRHELKQDINQVGPGQYKVPDSVNGPQYSMGAGQKGTKLNKDALLNPPPGTYDVNDSQVKHKSPGVSFGSSVRDKLKPDGMPGPGNYYHNPTNEGKGITIKGKYVDNPKERAPGPGAYGAPMDPSKVKGGNITFGNGTKSTGPKDSNAPGPGMYKVEAPYEGGHTFGKDIRDKQKESAEPGPGQYNWRKQEGLTYF